MCRKFEWPEDDPDDSIKLDEVLQSMDEGDCDGICQCKSARQKAQELVEARGVANQHARRAN